LAQAARMLQSQPASIQLRYLQTVTEIAAENNSTTIFPIPIDLLRSFMPRAEDAVAATSAATTQPATPTVTALPPADVAGVLASPGVADALPDIRIEAEPQGASGASATEGKRGARRRTS
jgi:hypothetical protein